MDEELDEIAGLPDVFALYMLDLQAAFWYINIEQNELFVMDWIVVNRVDYIDDALVTVQNIITGEIAYLLLVLTKKSHRYRGQETEVSIFRMEGGDNEQ